MSLQSFLAKNKVFSEVVCYDFEPCRHDKVSVSLNSLSYDSIVILQTVASTALINNYVPGGLVYL